MTNLQKMIWKVDVCDRPQKQKNTVFTVYTMLNTLSRECNFEISGLRKHFPKKVMNKITTYK